MPESIKQGADGSDYERCLVDLSNQGDVRFDICAKAYEAHHMKNDKGEWVRKPGHSKDAQGEWTSNHSEDLLTNIEMEIFSGGPQIDSNGVSHNGDLLIQKAIETFNPATFEPPIRLDHKEGPAYGWIKGLSTSLRDGVQRLVANVSLIPEAVDLVKRQLYKTRSAGFSGNGVLNHLALLGASPPAVKGLLPISLSEDDESLLLFQYEVIKKVIFNKEKEMTQEEVDALLKAKEDELNAKFEAYQFSQKQKEIQTYVDAKIQEGILTPAMVDLGIISFMESLVNKNFNFSEAENDSLSWFQKYIETAQRPVVEFKQVSTGDVPKTGLDEVISDLRAKNPELTFTQAFTQATALHPEFCSAVKE